LRIAIDKKHKEYKKIVMKNFKRSSKTILASILFITAFSYTNAQKNTEDKLIQRTRTFSDSQNTQW